MKASKRRLEADANHMPLEMLIDLPGVDWRRRWDQYRGIVMDVSQSS